MMAAAESIDIIALDADDLDTLLRWRMEVLDTVFAEDKPWDAEALRAANRDYYEDCLTRDEHIACVALAGGREAGCGAICLQREMPSPDNPSGRCAYLMNIYTRPAFRNRGVGRAVVDWLVAQAKRRGVGKIYLEATDVGAPLYAAAGFEPMAGMMKLQAD